MIRVSAPGKIMLAGEYAILSGGRALAQTIDARLQVSISPSSEGISIFSNLWDSKKNYPEDLLKTKTIGRREPVLESIEFFLKSYSINFGADIVIRSDLDVAHGVGSSSALRLSLFSALLRLLNLDGDKNLIADLAYFDQKQSQTTASGYDIMTQLHGGSVMTTRVEEREWPLASDIVSCPHLDQIEIWVGGAGAPTASTIANTKVWLDSMGREKELINISEELIDAFLKDSLKDLVESIDRQREFFLTSPMFPRRIEKALEPFLNKREWSWKTTGAGGEDAIILVGAVPLDAKKTLNELGWHPARYQFSHEGLRYDD